MFLLISMKCPMTHKSTNCFSGHKWKNVKNERWMIFVLLGGSGKSIPFLSNNLQYAHHASCERQQAIISQGTCRLQRVVYCYGWPSHSIIKVITIHPGRDMNACTKFDGNPSGRFSDIFVIRVLSSGWSGYLLCVSWQSKNLNLLISMDKRLGADQNYALGTVNIYTFDDNPFNSSWDI